ncbi:peptidase U32 family protein [Shewanella marina]|uniref:peptidase U32 family protein n=1 Tax=Shewanella marina TaxID=487319 RepID=UPI00046F50F4|nr:U32 family peptidase [Shewanella marina]
MSQPALFTPDNLQHVSNRIELLAPAKNLEYGMAAISHGADAVYIGGPAFGARAAAGNSIEDIAQLCEFAHRYYAQVFVAVNTILTDAQLPEVERLIWQIYEAGADALIVQDMGILQLNLPPIALHASTQMDNRSSEKVAFLEQVGFSQVVLARELNLTEIRSIAAMTKMQLEFFIHGALCVSYSGQCYISEAFTDRSANRGSCSQMCRLPCNLKTRQGEVLAENKHLLSLKDNNQTDNLEALIDAGIRSFKIEGRLKDLSYVKNVTAHYRQQLDAIIAKRADLQASSHGRCEYQFSPNPDKSFNRGKTDYFVNERTNKISDFESPKYLGEPAGTISHIGRDFIELDSQLEFNNGDGFCYFVNEHQNKALSDDKLGGLRINRAEANRLYLAKMDKNLRVGMMLYRNHDQAFETIMSKDSAKRRIKVDMQLVETEQGFKLTLDDGRGHQAHAELITDKVAANDPIKGKQTLEKQLKKLGCTDFYLGELELSGCEQYFFAASALNNLRRQAIDALIQQRADAYQRPEKWQLDDKAKFPENHLSYLGNVANQQAKSFYQQHGVIEVEPAYELQKLEQDAPLMITKHCLRYSFNLCPKEVEGIKAEPMVLEMGNEVLKLVFDCHKCEMMVVGKAKIKA